MTTNSSSSETYKEYWDILKEAQEKFTYLKDILSRAMIETIELIEKDIYVDDSYAITPLGWIAGHYEEVSDYCNQISLMIFDEQELNKPEIDFDALEDF